MYSPALPSPTMASTGLTPAGLTFPVFNIAYYENILPTVEKRIHQRNLRPSTPMPVPPTDPRLAGKRPMIERPLLEMPLRFKKRSKISGNVLAEGTEGSSVTLSDATTASLDIGMPPTEQRRTSISIETPTASSSKVSVVEAVSTSKTQDREMSPRRRSRSPGAHVCGL